MPCITLLLQTQHSRLHEAAQDLALRAASGDDSWPRHLYGFRQMLIRHDRMERDVFQRLGTPGGERLLETFDRALESQTGQDSVAVADAALRFSRMVESHADIQECDLFPLLVERHPDGLLHHLGDHYARISAGSLEFDTAEPAAA